MSGHHYVCHPIQGPFNYSNTDMPPDNTRTLYCCPRSDSPYPRESCKVVYYSPAHNSTGAFNFSGDWITGASSENDKMELRPTHTSALSLPPCLDPSA